MQDLVIRESQQTIKRNASKIDHHKIDVTAILEVEFPRFIVYVFPGTLSAFDILVKYKEDGKKRIRTPKHIHWAVDFLLKKQGEKDLCNLFLLAARHYWDLCKPLKDRSFDTLKELLLSGFKYFEVSRFASLNAFGEYDVDFLACLMILLAVQEKTNNPNAFMFKDVLDNLLIDDLDIFAVVSTSTFGGR